MGDVLEQLRARGHEQVTFCNDESSGLRAIIAIHDTTLGPAIGGVRMWPYKTESEALEDVLRLSRGMTFKAAAAGLNDSGAFPYLRSHPLTTERMADMQARQQLNTPMTRPAPDMAHAMMAARARVLSQNSPDALKAWIQGPSSLPASASPADHAAALYAATLSHLLLRDAAATQRHLQTLSTLLQSNRHLPSFAAAHRALRLLQAEVAERQENPALAVQVLTQLPGDQKLGRPEWMALAELLQRLPDHPMIPSVKTQLREMVHRTPLDAQAWDRLSGLLTVQGQTLAALRAAGEAQAARLDWPGAVDRFRAAQELAVKGRLQPSDHIEASIVDVRLRYARERLRALQAPQR